MSAEPVLIDHISKKFCRRLRASMLYGLQDIVRDALRIRGKPETLRRHEFWAVKDVSLAVRRGETVGIIGANGSGKSTLLKMLAGIFMPDVGRIEIRGKVGALIELGSGFHPLLTGRENIYLNGAVLGMSKREIDKKFDRIVEFSNISEFLDTPVKHYSSGMYARLGFSVAVHIDPDILLVDEVLSVGDIRFQNRALDRIAQIKKNASVIFVSHNLAMVSTVCDRALWLDRGVMRMLGDAREVVSEYSRLSLLAERSEVGKTDPNQTVSGDIIVTGIEFADARREVKDTFEYGEDLVLRCRYRALRPLGKPYFQFDVKAARSGTVFIASMLADGSDRPSINEGDGVIECHFKNLPLSPGIYEIDINIRPESGLGKLLRQISVAHFTVDSGYARVGWKGPLSVYNEVAGAPVLVPYSWRFPSAVELR